MSISLTKFLTAFSTSLALAALVPSISLAQTTTNPSSGTMTGGGTTTSPVAPTTPSGSSGGSMTGGTMTPTNVPSGARRSSTKRPQNPQVQAVRRQEMKDILASLDQNQREKFIEQVRKGKKPETALDSLNLKPDQQTRIQTIMSEANTKVTNLRSAQPSSSTMQQPGSPSVPQTAPTTTP